MTQVPKIAPLYHRYSKTREGQEAYIRHHEKWANLKYAPIEWGPVWPQTTSK